MINAKNTIYVMSETVLTALVSNAVIMLLHVAGATFTYIQTQVSIHVHNKYKKCMITQPNTKNVISEAVLTTLVSYVTTMLILS